MRVLFVGNSLTSTHDLPAMVQGLADAAGRSLSHAVEARPNFSLEDHVNAGIEATIRSLAPDLVVMQQGPSSLPENREHLIRWSGRLSQAVRSTGGRPALLMVWPSRSRQEAYDAVRESYRAAAEAHDGRFIPAGETWRVAWETDPDLDLYGSDGFHPSRPGSLAVALTIHRALFGEADGDGQDGPECPRLEGAGVPDEIYETLCTAARRSLEVYGIP